MADLVKKAKKLGINIFFNHAVIDTKGRKKINSVIISELDESLIKQLASLKNYPVIFFVYLEVGHPTVHLFSQSKR